MSRSILVVEDDSETRKYFAEVLSGDDDSYGGSDIDSDSATDIDVDGTEAADFADYVVWTAATLFEGSAALNRSQPDVLLVDLGLPDGDGLDLIREARKLSKEILILVITVFGDETSVVGAIEAGAQGYLLKAEAPADLRESVRQILSGGAPISPGIASHLLRRFQETGHSQKGKDLRFTRRELDVLGLMVKGLPYGEAAKVLGVTRNTVAGYVKSIYSKLEVNSRGEAVYEALSQGIVDFDPQI
jgi:DNA-binding NarL/FixJ family response regulator